MARQRDRNEPAADGDDGGHRHAHTVTGTTTSLSVLGRTSTRDKELDVHLGHDGHAARAGDFSANGTNAGRTPRPPSARRGLTASR